MKKYLKQKMKVARYEYLLLLTMTLLITCHSNHSIQKYHSYINDVTDEVTKLDSATVIKNMNVTTDIYDGAHFRYKQIESFKNGKVYEATLSKQGQLMENRISRVNAVKFFCKEISNTLNSVEVLPSHQSYSYVRSAIIDELQFLIYETAIEKKLFIYSDLIEHNANLNALNFYEKKIQWEIINNPAEIAERYFAEIELEELYGVEIYFTYESESIEALRLYESIANNIWKPYLESKHVQNVTITSLLQEQEFDQTIKMKP